MLELRGIAKVFNGQPVVDKVDLQIQSGEFFSILGPSGSGKTTLLRIVAGLETADAGSILVDGEEWGAIPAYARPVSTVFQSYALFPHMTVEHNIAFGLYRAKMPKTAIQQRVDEMLAMVHLENWRRRKPAQLSGGQQQRVALARALAPRPKLLLLDEPLAALDKKLREEMQTELIRLQSKLGITFIMVTHDQGEAMSMSTRMAVMHQGAMQQVGTPEAVYEKPTNKLVAEFIGAVNTFAVELQPPENDLHLATGEPYQTRFAVAQPCDVNPGSRVCVGVRPEKIVLTTDIPGVEHNILCGTFVRRIYLGNLSRCFVQVDRVGQVCVHTVNLHRNSERIRLGDKVYLHWQAEDAIWLADNPA